jgi:hypothetical protein
MATGLQSNLYELGFQHMTDTDKFYAMKQKCAEEGGKDKSEICPALRNLNSLQYKRTLQTVSPNKCQLCKKK